MNTAKFSIISRIEDEERDFYEIIRCIWQLNLPNEIKRIICKNYGKLCAQSIVYNNEVMDAIWWEEFMLPDNNYLDIYLDGPSEDFDIDDWFLDDD